jgi:restriction system protein
VVVGSARGSLAAASVPRRRPPQIACTVSRGIRDYVFMTAHDVPAYTELLLPTMVAVFERGGSGSIDEIVESVIKNEVFGDDIQAVLHGDGPQTEVEYRLAWARTYLKGMGLLINSKRGVRALTEQGSQLMTDPALQVSDVRLRKIRELHRRYSLEVRRVQGKKQSVRRPSDPDEASAGLGDSSSDWKDELLDAIMAMRPDGFERLAQRLLREAGFISATVSGRSGDGGIDGLGVYRLSLVSFRYFFSVNGIVAVLAPARCATFGVRWRVAVARGC